jgi:zinc D-Ala-D-Ala carboxypeptidase
MNAPLPPPPEGYESRLPRCAEAADLVPAGLDARERPILLHPEAAKAWAAMRAAAEKDGAQLVLVSGFRSVARQTEIIARKLARGQTMEEILRQSAYPGFSEHHTGLALDLGAPGCSDLVEAFAETTEFAWLSRHGGRFGFFLSYPRDNPFGIAYEPWHWRFKSPNSFL